MKIDFAALLAEVQKLEANGPAYLAALDDLLTKLDAEADAVLPVLARLYPPLAGLSAVEDTAIADLRAFISFLSRLQATTLPFVESILLALSKIFPAP